jgi:hypothetical protein
MRILILLVSLACLNFSTIARAEPQSEKETGLKNDLTAAQNRVAVLEERLDSLERVLSSAIQTPEISVVSPVTSGTQAVPYGAAYCPPGQVPVGLKAWGSPDTTRYCIGCLTGVALLCQPLPTKR